MQIIDYNYRKCKYNYRKCDIANCLMFYQLLHCVFFFFNNEQTFFRITRLYLKYFGTIKFKRVEERPKLSLKNTLLVFYQFLCTLIGIFSTFLFNHFGLYTHTDLFGKANTLLN